MVLLVSVLSVLSLSVVVDCCSCPQFVQGTRSYSLLSGICSGDVFVARVTGATCNCPPTAEEENVIYCHDYQLSGPNEITVELLDIGQCYGSQPYAVLVDSVQTCSVLADTSGLVIPNQGYIVQGPSNTTLPTPTNLTVNSYGHCNLPCILSRSQYPRNYIFQPGCFYTVTITEVIKGIHIEGQTLMVTGPDTLTSCGSPNALLKINEQYVVGVGGVCEPISAWSTLQSYSADELQTLRAFSRDFEAGNLTCTYSTEPDFTTTAVPEPDFTTTEPDFTTTAVTEPDSTVTSAAVTEPEFTTTAVTEPEFTTTAVTEPDFATTAVTEPEFTTTAVTEPDFTTTAVTEPDFTTTAVTEPDFTTTAVTEPDSTVTSAAVTEPGFTTTAVTEPEFTTTVVTEPEFTTTVVIEPDFTTTAVTSTVVDSFSSLISLLISSMVLVFMTTLFV